MRVFTTLRCYPFSNNKRVLLIRSETESLWPLKFGSILPISFISMGSLIPVLTRQVFGLYSAFVFFIKHTFKGTSQRRAILKAPSFSVPIEPSILLVPSGKIKIFPPEDKNSPIFYTRSIIREENAPTDVEGIYQDVFNIDPNTGTLKKVLFTMVLCFSSRETKRRGSK